MKLMKQYSKIKHQNDNECEAQEFYVQSRSHYFSAHIPWRKKSEGGREKG